MNCFVLAEQLAEFLLGKAVSIWVNTGFIKNIAVNKKIADFMGLTYLGDGVFEKVEKSE